MELNISFWSRIQEFDIKRMLYPFFTRSRECYRQHYPPQFWVLYSCNFLVMRYFYKQQYNSTEIVVCMMPDKDYYNISVVISSGTHKK